ncbi:molybdopterin-guanine dinucleotide biosynthesis protein MobA [Rubellimicrobium rubrum]|uniref:Molybdopterin-guanine dinucleotide biosynthesis protein MobA n=1 Tax=Rubellimicrobium rubrum TaxID=2585369 RepID=A0A5C4MM42_9RHOB|nr:MobQ family relaxase [Rubellimicrobium rubrum]TNC45268.1 molybdopterin-guanine dinucleotide biosynthesis protein MobA [Rubellimicrobium rubrum]
MASYHLSVKTVQRSAGRSATAAIAYRAAERITCEREGRVHDYRAKSGVEASFIVAPEDAPKWAHGRQALWNAAEARETRSNSVTAREWELALPHELDGAGRRELAHAFARELVARYGVAADVAIHAPHREGDQRNWHAHVLTTTRRLTAEGLTDKTRALDAKQTGGLEIAHMRERWAEMQNRALERAHVAERVDHRTLAMQRKEARALGHEARADNLDRAPEVKLGPVVSAIERREQRAAERDGHEYVPLTERGAQVHEARQARSLLAELARVREVLREQVRERAALARATYAHAREEGANQVRAGLAALRAAAERQGIGRGQGDEEGQDPQREREAREASWASIKERLGQIVGREAPCHAQDGLQHGPEAGLPAHGLERQGQERSLDAEAIRKRLEALQDRARPSAEAAQREEPAVGLPAHGQELGYPQEAHRARSAEAIREQLRGVLDRAKPVAMDREGMGQAHTERAHEEERDEHALKPKDRGISYGL